MSVVELARQLTLLGAFSKPVICETESHCYSFSSEHQLFSRIRAPELCNQAWLKTNKEVLAPNIMKCIHRFNLVSNWITAQILSADERARAATLEFWIKLANVRRLFPLLLCSV